VIKSLVYIFPAYSANAVPVILGGGPALDFGKTFKDGKPILGSHKTFKGFFGGLIIGTLVGIGESYLFSDYNLFSGFMLSLGALVGDLVGAFIKRRLGFSPGSPMLVIDQIDFVLGALFFSLFLNPPSLAMALVITILTIPIHMFTNFLAYLMHAKEKPW
jgi:CDP-2,3-bis-(O-geranylgeranyl)-sn-glycerol synthase